MSTPDPWAIPYNSSVNLSGIKGEAANQLKLNNFLKATAPYDPKAEPINSGIL